MWEKGDRVRKQRGYQWPGIVVSVFETLEGHTRIVVECIVPEVAGALHIYNPEQLEKDDRPWPIPYRGATHPSKTS